MEIKEPIIDEKDSFNFFTSIWIVPFIAAIIAAWLVYEHFTKMGPEIKIEFKNSGGLQAEQSVVKFRDVPVGKVTRIEINSKKDGVIVYARLNKDVEPFLNETTKFWVVKPEVDYSGIRGLDTLLSGSYIKMYAKKGKKKKREFIGLDSPYIDINDGYYYVIEANFPVKVKKGTPIYYKGVKVGEIDVVSLDTTSRKIILVARIYKDYKDMVNVTTKFWVQSLIDLRLNDNRLEVNMAPLPIMLLGGIAFDTKFDKKYDSGYNKIFKLYKSKALATKRKIGAAPSRYERFIFRFKGDVSSLEEGTSIKYKGFEVGKVKKLKINYNKEYKGFEAESLGLIDISNFSTNTKDGFENFKAIAKNGLIAELKKPNPLFNKSNIVLTEDNNSKVVLVKDPIYNAYVLPTKEFKNDGLLSKLEDISKKIAKLDLEHSVKNLNELLKVSKGLIKESKVTIKNINKIISTKDFKNLSKNVNKTLNSLNSTLKETKKVLRGYGSNSLFSDKVEATLKELHETTEKTNSLLRKLNKKPNALIFGD